MFYLILLKNIGPSIVVQVNAFYKLGDWWCWWEWT